MTTAKTRQADGLDPVHHGWLAEFRIDPMVMRLFVWSGLALVAMTVIGFAWLMQMVPPPSPTMTKEAALMWVSENQRSILIGAALCTFFWSFWVTWMAPILLYVRRMERVPVLTVAALANVGGGAAVITTIAVSWTVMAFRAEDPAIVQAFLDLGFFLFLYTWPPFGILMVIIAVAIFRDCNPHAAYPRWVAYYNIYAAIAMAPASFMGLFKTGPLAYNGMLAFWLVAVDFFTWMVVMSVMTFKAITADERRLVG
ncbi:signal transduction histidine kinase [Mycolicibacterium sp. BK634]|uniref:hypothetical protein n=1 Tax=Mycolicibacterium sp. BK634 TaxID=2587099 RepID=UPI00160C2916|nr:hypothetical protein [Mycolicibacterium sp. BK634]MBB3748389.1 signal transduction histidine kinase [Mycolicibacterium sp. BK634]